MNSTSLTWLVVVVVIAVLGGWYFFSTSAPAPVPTGQTQTNQSPDDPDYTPSADTSGVSASADVGIGIGDASVAPMSVAVIYGADGFSPKEVTVKVGGTVTWTNQGGGDMWVATAVHPTHSAYSGTTLSSHCDDATDTSFDQCKKGSSYSFTFTKLGTWRYHNHAQASDSGSVVVVE